MKTNLRLNKGSEPEKRLGVSHRSCSSLGWITDKLEVAIAHI